MRAAEAAMIMMSGSCGDNPSPVNNKLEEICNSKVLPIYSDNASRDIIPIDDTFHLSIHAQYSEDTAFMEQYNTGFAQIYTYSEIGLSGSFTYPVYRKNLNIWMVCWKNGVAQYANLIRSDYKYDYTSSYSVYTEDNNHYNILYYTEYCRPILASINGGGGAKANEFNACGFKVTSALNGLRFDSTWEGSITGVLTFYRELYKYVPTSNNIGIGSLELYDRKQETLQIGISTFYVVPSYNGCVTNLQRNDLETVVEDVCIAIINSSKGGKAERPIILKPN